jgi:hypothetical protein
VATIATLAKEVERLEARQASRRHEIPADRVQFARSLGFKPDSWQEQFLRSEALRVLLNIARQVGKTTTCGLLALHQALSVACSLVLILAPSERQSRELMRGILNFYQQLGHAVPADSERKLGLELANGSRIEALPGTERTIRTFSAVDLLLLEEAARVADDLYFAVRPMLAVSNGRLVMLSTPAGRRGIFHHEWSEGGDGWERYEVRADECPRISAEFLEEERRTLPAYIYRQEYECSFEDVEDAVFSYDLVMGALTPKVAPLTFAEDAW